MNRHRKINGSGRRSCFQAVALRMFCCMVLYAVLPVASFAQGSLETKPIPPQISWFKLTQVRLLPSPFLRAQEVDMAYMMKLKPDRLLAPYLKEAGLTPKAPNYPNWESEGLDGHIAGHYLSALSMMYASTGDKRLLDRLNYMITELKRCQDKAGDGYLGGIPDGRPMWEKVAAGDVGAIKTRWVPWYNLHKLFAGLRDAYEYTGNKTALGILEKLAAWAEKETSGLSEAQMQQMLQTESGGMNEVLADVAVLTGDPRYLRLAERFTKHSLLDPLLHQKDELTGLHANTQIPIMVGVERIAAITGNYSWQKAAAFFWNTVVSHRTVAFGGNSVEEHFNPINNFSKMIRSPQGPETCNTYNMLKLTRELYSHSANLHYMDYYERALYNHILSSENLDSGGFVYFTPIRPRHYRVFSRPQNSFWCCVGTGMENHSKYGGTIYAHTRDALLVNLFIPSVVKWKEKGVTLTQKNRFPDTDSTTLAISVSHPLRFVLKIRYPSWVSSGALQVRVNGVLQQIKASPDQYVSLERVWKTGDQVSVVLPMHTTIKGLPDGSDFVAVMEGPVVLAARTGTSDLKGEFADTSRFSHIASGKLYPLDQAPVLVGNPDSLASHIVRVKGTRMEFKAPSIIYPASYKNLKLIPFFRIGGARYMLYWQQTTRAGLKQAREEDRKLDDRHGS